MSTAALTAAAAALWPAFRRILIRIGRWLLRKLASAGSAWLARHMRRRIADFKDEVQECIERTARARTEAGKRRWRCRRRRFQRRIARWRYAAEWIAANARGLTKSVLRQYEQLAEKIPEVAPWESEAR